jgi:hypothetical protein
MKAFMSRAGISWETIRLCSEIAYARRGMRLPGAGIAILFGLGVCLIWLPLQYAAARQAAVQLQAASAVADQENADVPAISPLQRFKDQLLKPEETTKQVRLIFQLASQAGVNVSQVEMRRQASVAGVYSQLQIVLPFKGNYQSVKQYCLLLLTNLHALSIDQLVIRRDPASGEMDGQFSLSLWQGVSEGVRP